LWNVERGELDTACIAWAEAIVHLAGAPVADKRWNDARKKEIIDSRVKSSALLAKAIHTADHFPKVIIGASGTGYYGSINSERVFVETDPPYTDFLAECCRLWEEGERSLIRDDARLVILRIGVVLSNEGGALPKLVTPVKYFVGAPLGSGKQIMKWIHIDDLCALFLKSLTDSSLQGVYNATAPDSITNKEFTKAVGRAIHRPVFLPAVPTIVMKLIMGEMHVIVTTGSAISSEKLIAAGFKFRYTKVDDALKNLLG
jgi:uncharacterized protein (TIGR01777 family)